MQFIEACLLYKFVNMISVVEKKIFEHEFAAFGHTLIDIPNNVNATKCA